MTTLALHGLPIYALPIGRVTNHPVAARECTTRQRFALYGLAIGRVTNHPVAARECTM